MKVRKIALILVCCFALSGNAQVLRDTSTGAETMLPQQPVAGEGYGSRPIPDPTTLTTQQLQREVFMLRELLESRLNAYDKAITLLQGKADKSPSIDVIDENVKALEKVTDEKFASIQTQFKERDVRTDQSSKDSKVAVDAALQAAKEAVGEQNKSSALAIAKSEAATTKQIDQIGSLITLTTSGFNDKIEDLKSRVSTIDGHARGIGDGWGFALAGAGVVLAVATIVMTRPARIK